jgi:cytochrome c oxidase cbb3-type subunit IV
MNVNDMRIAATVLGLVVFLAIVIWAWSRKRKDEFESAAALPFLDDEPGAAAPGSAPSSENARGGAR